MKSAKKTLITLAALAVVVPLVGFPPTVEMWIIVLLGLWLVFLLTRNPSKKVEKTDDEPTYVESKVSEGSELGQVESNDKSEPGKTKEA